MPITNSINLTKKFGLENASKLITTLNKDLSKKDTPNLRIAEILFSEANGKIKQ